MRQLVLMTVGLGLGTFLVSLDFAVANVAIPHISGDLAVSPSQGTWAITSFAAANAIALPLTGWLARRYGEVRTFVASGLLFVLSSALCGLSPNLPTLVLFRIFQGACSGPMLPLSQAILLHHYPDHLKGMAMAMVSLTVTIAPLMGPIVGGAITDNLTWPWIFYINIPIGLLAAGLVWLVLRHKDTPPTRNPIDGVGLALLVLGVVCLQVFLDKGQELDWLHSPVIVALGIGAALALAYFVVWELTDRHPVVNLRLVADRNFIIGLLGTTIPWACLFAGLVIFPLWLQTNMGYTATWAGLATGAFGLFIMLLTPIVGRNLHRANIKLMLTACFVLLFAGMQLGARLNTDATFWDLALPRLVMGMGLGLFFVPLLTIALSNIAQPDMPGATGLFYFARTLGTSIGVSIGITLWERREIFHHARLAEVVGVPGSASGGAVGDLGVLQAMGATGHVLGDQLIHLQARILGANDVFFAMSWLLPPMLLLIWLAKPPFLASRR